MYGYLIRSLFLFLCLSFCTAASGSEQQAGKDTSLPEKLFHLAEKQFNRNVFDSALANYALAYEGFTDTDNKYEKIRSLLVMADIKRIYTQFDSSFILLGKAKHIIQESDGGFELLLADFHLKYGNVKFSQGIYEDAAKSYIKSLELIIQHSGLADTNLVMVYNNLGIVNFRLGLFERSAQYYHRAEDIIELGTISHNRHVGFTYQNLGILYSTLGDYESAGTYFARALEIFEALFDPDDSLLGRYYLNYGRMLQTTGQSDIAMEYYDHAERIFVKHFGPDYSSLGTIMMNKATVYVSYSDYEKALNYSNRALSIFQKNFPAGHPNILKAYNNIGHYFEVKGNYNKAIEYYQMSIDNERVTSANIVTYRNIARIYNLIGETEKADRFYSLAIENSKQLFGKNHPETAHSYLNYARFLTREAHFNKAHELLIKASNIYLAKLGAEDREYSNTLFQLGVNYAEKGEPENALLRFQQAIIALSRGFNDTDPLANPSTEQLTPDHFLLNALSSKAGLLHEIFKEKNDKSQLLASLEAYELSAILINKIRNSFLSEESRLMITSLTSGVLTGALDCALDLYYLTNDPDYLAKAFEYSEKGKAAILLASIQDLEARQVSMLPDEIQSLERTLNHSLESYNQLIYEERLNNEPDDSKIKIWQTRTFELNRQYDSLINAIHLQYPDYYELKFALSTIPLSTLQESLSADQVLIEFTMGAEKLFVFAITSDTIVGIRNTLDIDFQDNLNKIRTHLTGANLDAYNLVTFNEFASLSNFMYRTLILPIEEIIQGRRLIIVPDNQLGYLPFEVLLTSTEQQSDRIDFTTLPYLVNRHAISYVYSATLNHKKMQRRQTQPNGKILALAPSYDDFNSAQASSSRFESLLPIPWAVKEVKDITGTYKGIAYTGARATEALFKKKAPDYQILHLAMHTIIDNESPMFSKLIFAQHQDSIEDGMLNTYELFNLELNAELAVLSACQTGDGRLQRGEGIMSMARGFFYAGVPSIIMTLWEADDLSSSELVVLFYDYLAKGLEKDKALQRAKLDFLSAADRMKSHPHYWAGFVNIGNTEPVSLQKTRPAWQIFSLAAFLIIAFAVYLLSRNRQCKK